MIHRPFRSLWDLNGGPLPGPNRFTMTKNWQFLAIPPIVYIVSLKAFAENIHEGTDELTEEADNPTDKPARDFDVIFNFFYFNI